MTLEADDLLKLPAVSVVDLIRRGQLTSRAYCQAAIGQIERLDPVIHAFAWFDPDDLLRKAAFIDDLLARNIDIDPVYGIIPRKLCGIPVGIKDIFNTEEMPTCMGSPIWEGFAPGNDARVVTRIKRAGGLVGGKTVTAEFAVHHPGPTCNPHNVEYSPGTSSSGSAAAVASYMLPLAIGTQTAGSTIRPASYCGIYGFKPSFGLISRTGVLKTLDTLDHVTLLSRHLQDLEYLFNITRVNGPNYPFIEKHLVPDFERPKSSWRVAFVKTHTWACTADYVKEEITKAAAKIGSFPDVEMREVELPEAFTQSHEIHGIIYEKALAYYFNDEFSNNPDKVSPIMTEMILKGREISVETYQENMQRQVSLRYLLEDFFDVQGIDVIFCHSTADIAPYGLAGRERPDPCLMWTLCGTPSLNLPLFHGPLGMPFGAQIVGRRYRDYTLLRFAQYLMERLEV